MKKLLTAVAVLSVLGGAACAQTSAPKEAANPAANQAVNIEQFSAKVLTTGLQAPWDMQFGDDGYLWVTEREGKQLTRVNVQDGSKKVVVKIDEIFTGSQHEGLLGFTFDPDFAQNHYLYTAYTYKDNGREHAKIIRLTYDPATQTAGNPVTLMEKLPADDDHNGGRVRFAADGKLHYTIGENGRNQGTHLYQQNKAQYLPTAEQIANKDYSLYLGKTLRMNKDGSIPADNPVINGVKSHIFTYGHRNPQGLVVVNGRLFSSEQGPSSDDEINILQAGGNYGWPHVAGFVDNQAYAYINHSKSKQRPKDGEVTDVKPQKETDWKGKQVNPLKTFFTVREGYNFTDPACSTSTYICWPTISPASINYYPENGKNAYWRNSLIVSSLKNGALYVLPLNSAKDNVQGDVRVYLHSQNRYRNAVPNADGSKIYVATDVRGNVIGKEGKVTDKLENPGSILEFTIAQ